jgi:FtsZ-interacting cell division protein ZipA
MLDLFIIALMTAIFGALLFGYQTARKKGKEIVQEKNKFENMSNNQLNSMTTVNYRGEDIPMTVLEKKTIWDNITREGKNDVWSKYKQQKRNQLN